MDNKQRISTHVLPGLLEFLPAEQILFDRLVETIRKVYESYGFVPLDTPLIERSEVLLSKAGGETEKQIYRFLKGDTDMSLRFDLTVPLARYVSEHARELVFPFRRYHIAKVYRGEKPQKGRYREFYQCDIDIIGNEKLPLAYDAEVLAVVSAAFKRLDFGRFVMRISNRKIMSGALEFLHVADRSVEVLQAVDKLEKIGADAVRGLLQDAGIPEKSLSILLTLIKIRGGAQESLHTLKNLGIDTPLFIDGITELEETLKLLSAFQVPDEEIQVDLSVARGLDYYTGMVFETVLVDYPDIGSVCSGGRYENLAEQFSAKKLPGVGASIGLTRLFMRLREEGVIHTGAPTTALVLVIPVDAENGTAIEVAAALRTQEVPTEISFMNTKLQKQLEYANKIGVPFVVIIGEKETQSSRYLLKDMTTGAQEPLTLQKLIARVKISTSRGVS